MNGEDGVEELWVQAILCSTLKQRCPRGEVLNKEIFRMKFNKTVVIIGKFMSR
jgi:hypothetical protein